MFHRKRHCRWYRDGPDSPDIRLYPAESAQDLHAEELCTPVKAFAHNSTCLARSAILWNSLTNMNIIRGLWSLPEYLLSSTRTAETSEPLLGKARHLTITVTNNFVASVTRWTEGARIQVKRAHRKGTRKLTSAKLMARVCSGQHVSFIETVCGYKWGILSSCFGLLWT